MKNTLPKKIFIEIKAPPAHEISNRKVNKQITVYYLHIEIADATLLSRTLLGNEEL